MKNPVDITAVMQFFYICFPGLDQENKKKEIQKWNKWKMNQARKLCCALPNVWLHFLMNLVRVLIRERNDRDGKNKAKMRRMCLMHDALLQR